MTRMPQVLINLKGEARSRPWPSSPELVKAMRAQEENAWADEGRMLWCATRAPSPSCASWWRLARTNSSCNQAPREIRGGRRCAPGRGGGLNGHALDHRRGQHQHRVGGLFRDDNADWLTGASAPNARCTSRRAGRTVQPAFRLQPGGMGSVRRGDHLQRGAAHELHLRRVLPPLLLDLCPPIFVGPGIKTGMPILYDNPKRGGGRPHRQRRGRLRALPPQDLIVVDFGTATTFDCVSAAGRVPGRGHRPGHR